MAILPIVASLFITNMVAAEDSGNWQLVLDYQPTTVDVGQSTFNQLFWDSPYPILKRLCSTCGSDHDEIYYKRLTSVDSFDLYSYTDNWLSTDNVLGTDFNLYSTWDDALSDTNPWTFCNYDDTNIGMFRDCGPSGAVAYEWTSRVRGGDTASFYIYTSVTTLDPTTEPTEAPTEFHCSAQGCDANLVCDALSGQCIHDCDVLHIDAFLSECSSEWDENNETLTAMSKSIADNVVAISSVAATASSNAAEIAALTASSTNNSDGISEINIELASVESSVQTNSVEIAAVIGTVANNTAVSDKHAQELVDIFTMIQQDNTSQHNAMEIESNTQEINAMKLQIEALEATITKLGVYSAESQIGNLDVDPSSKSMTDLVGGGLWSGYSLSTQDLVIIGLVVVNLVILIGLITVCAVKRGMDKKKRYKVVQFDESE